MHTSNSILKIVQWTGVSVYGWGEHTLEDESVCSVDNWSPACSLYLIYHFVHELTNEHFKHTCVIYVTAQCFSLQL